jgi:hypothetical protein
MSIGSASRAMSSTGTSMERSSALRRPASTMVIGRAGVAEILGDLLERPLRRRQPDALEGLLRQRLEPLEREREVRPTLGGDQRVDLVDDHGVEAAEGLARVRGEQQIERFGRRDDDVGRLAQEAGPLARRRVPGPDQDGGRPRRLAAAARGLGDAHDGSPQVALDVDRERLEGRHVEHPAAALRLRLRLEHQPVQAPEEGRQGLAAAGRGQQERRLAAGDRGPPLGLGGGRAAGEGALEPGPHGGMKRRKPHPRILPTVAPRRPIEED